MPVAGEMATKEFFPDAGRYVPVNGPGAPTRRFSSAACRAGDWLRFQVLASITPARLQEGKIGGAPAGGDRGARLLPAGVSWQGFRKPRSPAQRGGLRILGDLTSNHDGDEADGNACQDGSEEDLHGVASASSGPGRQSSTAPIAANASS